jgi:hypothetical protein
MSGSPKYTTAQLTAQRQAELAARVQQREFQRQQRLAREREQRLAVWRTALVQRHRAQTSTIVGLAASAGDAGQADAQRALQTQITALGHEITRAAHQEHDMQRLDAALSSVESQTSWLGLTIAVTIAQQQRQASLDALTAALARESDRAHLDPQGFAEVNRRIAAAAQGTGNPQAFGGLHRAAAEAVSAHLAQVRKRAMDLARMTRDANEVTGLAQALLAGLEAADLSVDGQEELRDLLGQLEHAVAAEDVDGAAEASTRISAAMKSVDAAYEQLVAEQDRADLVLEALVAALPRAGLQVVKDSLVADATGVRLAARQSDGTQIGILVTPQEGGTARIEYRAPGRDFAVEATADGEVAVCDLTEQVLVKLHSELGQEDVETDGLRWSGQPRPDQRAARKLRTRTSGERRA